MSTGAGRRTFAIAGGAELPLAQLRLRVGSLATGTDALLVIGVALVGLVHALLVGVSFQADSWLALVNIRELVTLGLPHRELLTVMEHGHAFVNQQWLAQLIIYGLVVIGGFGAIAAVVLTLQIVTITGAVVAARRFGASSRTTLVVLAFAWWLTLAPSQVRSEQFVAPIFALVIYLLATDSRRPSRRAYWCLPLLVVWANLHGSVMLGAALVALRGATLAWERRHELARARNWRRPLALITIPWACVLATPYGLGTVAYYRMTLLDPALRRWVSEWQPVTALWILAIPCFLLIAGMVWSFARNRTATTSWEKLALSVLAAAAVYAERNAIWFGLAAAMLLPAALDRWLAPRNSRRPQATLNSVLTTVVITGVAFVCASAISGMSASVRRHSPTKVLSAVNRAIAADPSLRVFADVTIADWLQWRQPALETRLAYNGQLELLGAQGLDRVEQLNLVLGKNWSSAARGYRLLVLNNVDRRSVTAFEHQAGTEMLYRGEGYTVLLRPRSAGA
jgi:hypothetical protein